MKRVAILQSNYLPKKGYFDTIASVDEFALYDCVQHTRRDWRNRNKVKTRDGVRWITVPARSKGRYLQAIDETAVDGDVRARLESAGYRVLAFRSFVTLLMPVLITSRLMARRSADLALERTAIRAGADNPFGGSLLAVAQRVP